MNGVHKVVHIWHEDSDKYDDKAGKHIISSTTQFWNFLKQKHISKIIEGADIKGYNGNNNLMND